MKNRFIKYFILALSSVLASVILVNFVVDPLQYYRRNVTYPLFENDRWQVASFVRTFSFDTGIMGTSLTQNFSLVKIKNTLGGVPIKLSIAGATVPEQMLVLDSALKSGKMKKVIWGIDRYYFSKLKEKQNTMPAFLYKGHFIGNVKYLANIDVLSQSLRVILRKSQMDPEEALESYNSWWKTANFSKEVVLKNYEGALYQPKRNHDSSDTKKEILQKILSLVSSYPETEFIFFFPPYSLAYQKKEYHVDRAHYYEDMQFREHMLIELTKLKNVKVYDFETDLDIVRDLNNYKDLTHYSKNVNDYIIDCISCQKNLVAHQDISNSQSFFHQLPHQNFK